MQYSREEIISECQKALADSRTFYQKEMINYRGKTFDTNEYYTEVIAEFLCMNINDFIIGIPQITRKATYAVSGHTGNVPISNREEERIAIEMFNQSSKDGCVFDHIGEVIDYQIPLKSKKDDVAGKIDLLAFDGSVLRILELKKPDNVESMLRCVLEGYTYLQTVDKNKLILDFGMTDDICVKASPFVYYEGTQKAEMMQNRKWLTKLMELLDSRAFYYKLVDKKYFVLEEV